MQTTIRTEVLEYVAWILARGTSVVSVHRRTWQRVASDMNYKHIQRLAGLRPIKLSENGNCSYLTSKSAAASKTEPYPCRYELTVVRTELPVGFEPTLKESNMIKRALSAVGDRYSALSSEEQAAETAILNGEVSVDRVRLDAELSNNKKANGIRSRGDFCLLLIRAGKTSMSKSDRNGRLYSEHFHKMPKEYSKWLTVDGQPVSNVDLSASLPSCLAELSGDADLADAVHAGTVDTDAADATGFAVAEIKKARNRFIGSGCRSVTSRRRTKNDKDADVAYAGYFAYAYPKAAALMDEMASEQRTVRDAAVSAHIEETGCSHKEAFRYADYKANWLINVLMRMESERRDAVCGLLRSRGVAVSTKHDQFFVLQRDHTALTAAVDEALSGKVYGYREHKSLWGVEKNALYYVV